MVIPLSRLADGRLLDIGGSFPKVLTPNGWVDFDGRIGDISDSVPLTNEEIDALPPSILLQSTNHSYIKTNNIEEKLVNPDKLENIDQNSNTGDWVTAEWKVKGDVLYKLGKYQEAVSAYEEALKIVPGYASAWNNMGVALSRLGERGKAMEAFIKAERIDWRSIYIFENKENILHDEMPKRDEYFKVPEGLHRCEICGEYNGKVQRKDLNWETTFEVLFSGTKDSEEYIGVSCLCKGPLCKKCEKNRIHRPISNSYDEKKNTFGHWPWFTGMMHCAECRQKEKEAEERKGK